MADDGRMAASTQANTPAPVMPLEAATVQPTAPLPDLRKGETLDSLLTPTTPATADPGFVHFGSLRVEASLAADFQKAERYLAKDPDAVKLLSELVHDTQPHTIHRIDHTDPEGDRFAPKGSIVAGNAFQHGGEIYWNPTGALRNTDGSANSPAIALLHEQGHSWEWTSDANGYLRGVSSKTQRFSTAEEQRNERSTEAHAAKILGEPIRENHLGQSFEVDGPASRTPVPTPKRTFTSEELKTQIDLEVTFYKEHGYQPPPPAPNKDAIVPWDHKTHDGSFLQIDEHTAVQHVGRGNYQVYDIAKDLGGHVPPQFEVLNVNQHGVVAQPGHDIHEQGHAR